MTETIRKLEIHSESELNNESHLIDLRSPGDTLEDAVTGWDECNESSETESEGWAKFESMNELKSKQNTDR